MTDVRIDLDTSGLEDGLGNLLQAIDPGLDEVLRHFMLPLQNQMRTTVSTRWGARTGAKYKRGKNWHTASAPGEPPAEDTGHLKTHINHAYGKGYFDVGTRNVPYASILENDMNRPFLERSAEGIGQQIADAFIARCRRA